jgi:hypothetical protein
VPRGELLEYRARVKSTDSSIAAALHSPSSAILLSPDFVLRVMGVLQAVFKAGRQGRREECMARLPQPTPAMISHDCPEQLAEKMGPGHTIVTILCDGAYRYADRLFSRKWLESKKLLGAVPEHLHRYIVLE